MSFQVWKRTPLQKTKYAVMLIYWKPLFSNKWLDVFANKRTRKSNTNHKTVLYTIEVKQFLRCIYNKEFSSIVSTIMIMIIIIIRTKTATLHNDNGDDSIKCGFRLKIPDEKPQQQAKLKKSYFQCTFANQNLFRNAVFFKMMMNDIR